MDGREGSGREREEHRGEEETRRGRLTAGGYVGKAVVCFLTASAYVRIAVD